MRSIQRTLLAVAVLAAPAGLAAQAPPAAPPAPPSTPASAAVAPAAPQAPAAPAYRPSYDEALQLGRLVTERAYAKNIDGLVSLADPAAGSPDSVRTRLVNALAQVEEQLGPELKLVSERVMLVNGRVQYWRVAEYTGVPIPLVWRVVMGEKGKWRGFTASPEEQAPPGEEIKP